jgi:hypothetical protein
VNLLYSCSTGIPELAEKGPGPLPHGHGSVTLCKICTGKNAYSTCALFSRLRPANLDGYEAFGARDLV